MAKSTYELINEFREEMNKNFVDLKNCMVSKDRYEAEVPPLRDALSRINWIILTAVIVALLTVVIKNPQIFAR